MNSIGSSIVRMWIARSSFMRSTMAASVDDLPEPVGPVTRTMPLRSGTMLARNPDRNQSHDDGARRALLEDVHAEPRDARERVGQVSGSGFLELRGGDDVA